MRRHNVFFFTSLVVLLLVTDCAPAQVARNFGLSFSRNMRGGIITFGNTVMNAVDSFTLIPDLVRMNETSNASNTAGGLGYSRYGNDQSLMKWVDIDGLTSTRNSSSADLTLPGGTDNIRFARIYWGGRMPVSAVTANPDTIRKIKLRKGNSGSYTVITAQEVITIRAADSTSLTYQAYADITNFIEVNRSGTYSTADVPATEEDFDGGPYGGWAITVAFSNPSFPYYSLRVYDGFAQVYNAGAAGSLPITLTGLNAPSTPLLPEDAILGAVTWEGDASLAGDFLQVNNITVSNAINPATNFFNGSISRNGSFITTKNPNYSNQMGVDIDEIYVGTGYNIQANTNSVNFLFNTTTDLYFPGVFTFAIKARDPVITIEKAVSDANGSGYADGNEILTYTLSGMNMGPDTSYNTFIIDTLPSNVTYIPGSLQVVNAPGITPGIKTDAMGDDQAFVSVAGGKTYVKFYIGNGATANTGGILPVLAGSAYTVKFKVRTAATPTTVTNLGRIQGQTLSGDILTDDATVAIYLNTSTGINETQVACDSFTWRNTTYTISGTYTFSYVNSSGTPSIDSLFLTILNSTSSNNTLSLCSNLLPYSWNGLTLTQSGVYTKTGLTNVAGCDSTAILNLTVKQNTASAASVSVCQNQLPYIWNNLSFTQSGSQTIILTNAAGCDSLTTLNLTVNAVSSSLQDITICSSQLPYVWNGLTFTQSGSQTDTLTNAAGCDSLITLNLTVNPVTNSTTNVSVCQNQLPYIWNNLSFTQSGSQTIILTNTAGCDSLTTLNLTVNEVSSSLEDITICSSQLPYVWNGLSFTQTGSQTIILTNAAGCDSVVTLDLTVNSVTGSTTEVSVCSNYLPYLWNGLSFTQSGSQTIILTNAAGCDSLATLILSITPASVTNTDVTICERELPYVWNGNSYTQSTNQSDTLINSEGCDSIVSLSLTVINCDPPCMTENFNTSPAGWTLSQGARIHYYSNPANNCVQDRGIITPGVGGNDPARVRTPNYTSSGAASIKVLFDIFVFDANLRCQSWKNYPCSTSVDVYYYVNGVRYLGAGNYVLPPNGPGNSPTVEVIFSAGNNLPAGTVYAVELDFKFKSGTGNCVQQNTKYVLDNFSVCELQCPVCPAAPAYSRSVSPAIAAHVIKEPEAELKLWPVPSSGIINLEVFNFIAEKIDIVDMSGRQVRSIPYTSMINLSSLPEGHYLLRAHGNKGTLAQRVWLKK